MIRSSTSAYTGSVPKIGGDFARFVADRQATEYQAYFRFGEWEHPSKIVRDKSEPGERLGEVYERMLHTDATLAGLEEKRTNGVLALPWSIEPGDETPLAREIADQAARMVDGIRNLDANLRHQLGGVARGVAFEELRWEPQTMGALRGLWAVVEMSDRPMWRFAFRPDGTLCVRQRDGITLQPVPAGRILQFAHATKDNPWGFPILDKTWWFWWLTLHGWKYFGVAIEKWPQPTVKVGYEEGTDDVANADTIAKALAVAADIQTEYAVAIPKGLEVGLIEAQRAGSVAYETFLQLLDRAKALFFLGEVDTSGLSQGPGSFAKNRVSNEVRFETIVTDACELAGSLTDGLIRPFVLVNYGPTAPMPYWHFEVDEASDRELRQAGVEKMVRYNLPITRDYMYRVHQCPQPRAGEPIYEAAAGTAPTGGATQPPISTAALAADWSDQELVQ